METDIEDNYVKFQSIEDLLESEDLLNRSIDIYWKLMSVYYKHDKLLKYYEKIKSGEYKTILGFGQAIWSDWSD